VREPACGSLRRKTAGSGDGNAASKLGNLERGDWMAGMHATLEDCHSAQVELLGTEPAARFLCWELPCDQRKCPGNLLGGLIVAGRVEMNLER